MNATHRLALPSGTHLNDYEISRVLGQGGFGITYLGYNAKLEQQVAVKEYLPSAFATRDGQTLAVQPIGTESEQVFNWGLQRFLDEARILARLSHPNIVRVLYYMSLNQTGYMVMEYLEGQTLGDAIRGAGSRPMPQGEVLRILDPLTDALALVHDNGLAHRDIKPDNIFLRHGMTPVLIDFGAARNVFTGRSQTVAAIVTPGYSPNEQYSGAVDQGPWTDIYALGAVVYFMVAGMAPPDAPSRIAHQMEGTPDPCRRLTDIAGPSYDRPFLEAIDWALKLRANERPQSIRQWREALGLGPRAVSAAATLGQPPVSPTIHHPVSPSWPEPLREANEPSPAKARLPELNRFLIPLAAGLVAIVAGLGLWWGLSGADDSIGSDLAEAFPLGTLGREPMSITDAIGGGDREDYVRFNLAQPSEVRMQVQEGSDDAFELKLLKDGTEPTAMFRHGAARVAELPSGHYTLMISSTATLSHDYSIRFEAEPLAGRPRPGTTPATALDLTGAGATDGKTILYSGRIWPNQREQFFRFRLRAASRVSALVENSAAQGNVSFVDASSVASVARELKPGTSEPLIAELPAGDHFLALNSRGEQPWDYKIKLLTEVGTGGAVTGSAREGQTIESAQLLPDLSGAPQSFDIHFSPGRTERYFAIRARTAGQFTAEVAGGSFNALELYRAETGARLSSASQAPELSLNTNIDAERYVIRIGSNTPADRGKLNLALRAGTQLGATERRPITLGSVGEAPISHSGTLTPDQGEIWFSIQLDQARDTAFELSRADGGPLMRGTVLSVLDRDRDRTYPFIAEDDGDLLLPTVALERGPQLVKLRIPDQSTFSYKLKLFAQSAPGGAVTGEGAESGQRETSAQIARESGATWADAWLLAKSEARATVIGSKAVPTGGGTGASPAQLMGSLGDGIPYRERWKARWLNDNKLTVTLRATVKPTAADTGLTASLSKPRFAAGEPIEITLKSDKALFIGLFAWQADGTVGRLFPQAAGQSFTTAPGSTVRLNDKLNVQISSAPLPGADASEEALLVLACPQSADFASLAPSFAEAALSSLAKAIESAPFFEKLAGLCSDQLRVRVLSYRVENKSG